jgi:antitoxin component YwqK of YwqJK toxin-antitoxin module
MSRIFLLSAYLFLSITGNAQVDTLHQYYDAEGYEITASKATFHGKRYKMDSLYYSVNYHIKSHWMVTEAYYSDPEYSVNHGPFRTYYVNGPTQLKGNYYNGKKVGIWKNFSEDGKITDSIFFENDEPVRHFQIKNGMVEKSYVKSSNSPDIFVTEFDEEGQKEAEGYQNYAGLPIGVWKTYEADTVAGTKTYNSEGELQEEILGGHTMFSKSNAKKKEDSKKPKLTMPGTPTFPGGEPQFNYYIENRIQNPIRRRYKNLDIFPATSRMTIIIDSEGRVKDVIIVQSIHPSIDAELRRALKNMPKWNMNGFTGAEFRLNYSLRIQ